MNQPSKSPQETKEMKSTKPTKEIEPVSDAKENPINSSGTSKETTTSTSTPTPKNKGNLKTKEARAERLSHLKGLLDNYGYFNISGTYKEEWAAQWNVSVKQIEDDIDELITGYEIPKIKKTAGRFNAGFQKAMRESHSLMNSPDPAQRAAGIDRFNKTVQTFTEFLEEYGFKEKIAEKIAIEQGNALKEDNPEMQKLLKGMTKQQQNQLKEVLFK